MHVSNSAEVTRNHDVFLVHAHKTKEILYLQLMQLNVCLSENNIMIFESILYTDVKYSTIIYKYSTLINDTVCQILCRKLNFIEFIVQELVMEISTISCIGVYCIRTYI